MEAQWKYKSSRVLSFTHTETETEAEAETETETMTETETARLRHFDTKCLSVIGKGKLSLSDSVIAV